MTFMRIGASEVDNWQYSFQSAMEVQVVQHDNAHPHTSLRTQEAIAKFGWTALPHPPYSPDLAPSDFRLFGPMKDALRGTRFEDEERVIRAVSTWLREQETSWYREGMHALVSRLRKAVDVDGDYVENSMRKGNIQLYCA
jgi:histone-lysine N-methyltransferase SETMAR